MFWDSSAIVPVLVSEHRSGEMTKALAKDREATWWWCSPVECASALQRKRREGEIAPAPLELALRRLQLLQQDMDVILASTDVLNRALRLVSIHPLRAADALQLAAALSLCGERPEGQSFVCLDERLRETALREGFDVKP